MARSNQYEYMEEETIGPALLCVICRRPFKDPRCAPCNHIFCRECIIRWMVDSGATCPAPTCRRPVSADILSRISGTLSKMLDALYVKCLLCGRTRLQRGNFDDHINRTCPNARERLPPAIIPPFPLLLSEPFAENRQLKEQCQQQLSQMQKYQAEIQLQRTEIERANERSNQLEALINELINRITANDLSTARFLSTEPLSSEEKSYYEQCKEYYHLTKQPLISVADEVFDDNTEIPSATIKFGIDEDCNKFDLQDFLSQVCSKLNIKMNDIVVKRIQIGSAILETEIYNQFESKDKKIHLKMIYHKFTDELKLYLAKMKVFFMFMGPIQVLKKLQKHRAEIKLNPQHNRIYARGHVYWQGALSDGKDRGGKPYYCPVGWQRSSFYVTENFYEKFKGWCICYHGTKFPYGLSILLNGLKPAKVKAHGAGIYATPSINYACHPRYAGIKQIESSSKNTFFKSGHYIQFVLECRVQPSNIKKIAKETLGAKSTIDPNINNEVIEWLIDSQKKSIVDFNDRDASIICTGLLTRVTDKHPGLLPESQWWYTCSVLGDIDLDSLIKQKQSGDTCNIIFN